MKHMKVVEKAEDNKLEVERVMVVEKVEVDM